MRKTSAELRLELAEAERREAREAANLRKLGANMEIAQVAEKLHRKMCHANHTDGCSWEYETWADPGIAKEEFLKKAKALVAIVDTETAFRVCEVL